MAQRGENKDTEDTESQLIAFLAGRDVMCPQCSYNLRDLRAARCPECGEQLVLRVNLAEPKQRLLIAGLIALSAGAGLNGLLIAYFFVQIILRGWGEWWLQFLVVNSIGLAVEGGVLAVWLWQWRRIRRMSLGARVRLTILCFALTLANLVLFSVKIR
jgi:DNA-directed RNA polymerase subunit RPC12/RpoP